MGCGCEVMLVCSWVGRERLVERDPELILGLEILVELGEGLRGPEVDIVQNFDERCPNIPG